MLPVIQPPKPPGRRRPRHVPTAEAVLVKGSPDVYGPSYLASGFRGRLRVARLDLG